MEKYFNILFILLLTVLILSFISTLILRKMPFVYFYYICSLIVTILSLLALGTLIFLYCAQCVDRVGLGANAYCLRILLFVLKKLNYFNQYLGFLKDITRIERNIEIIEKNIRIILGDDFKGEDTLWGLSKNMHEDFNKYTEKKTDDIKKLLYNAVSGIFESAINEMPDGEISLNKIFEFLENFENLLGNLLENLSI